MKKTKLPESFRGYFWDVDFDTLHLEDAPLYVLKRVLDRGNIESIKWITRHYTKKDIRDIIVRSRDISRRTAIFWANILGIKYNEIKCLKIPYSPIPFGLSS